MQPPPHAGSVSILRTTRKSVKTPRVCRSDAVIEESQGETDEEDENVGEDGGDVGDEDLGDEDLVSLNEILVLNLTELDRMKMVVERKV